MRAASWALTLMAAWTASCDQVEPRTQVMLIVDADAAVRAEAHGLQVAIDGALQSGAGGQPTTYNASFDATTWPYRFALTPRNGELGRRYKIALTALGAEGKPVALLRREGGFVPGKTLALVIRFEAKCLGEASLRCPADKSCEAGDCVSASIDERTLPGLFEIDGGALPETGTTSQGVSAAGSEAAAGSGGAGASGGASGAGPITTGVSDCGDGMLGPDELCDTAIAAGQFGACPQQCTPAKPCESSHLEGSGCRAQCVTATISARVPDDGCCPVGADTTNDPDCKASCGNSVIESGETCDPVSSCPTTDTCKPTNQCFVAMVGGAADSCSATCTMKPISACVNDDDCCPSGCTRANDNDCSQSCGDGMVGPRETCEPSSATQRCPTSCDDGNECTFDVLTGSASNCNALCTHLTISNPFPLDGCCPHGANANNDSDCQPTCGNGVVESGERCDGVCPETDADCSDNDSCTRDAVTGRDCQRSCTHSAMVANRLTADGCCPAGADANSDRDCPARCGNAILEPGERCDGNCPTNCDDGIACTADFVDGSDCQRTCAHRTLGPNTASKDGCCPSGNTLDTDADCPAAPPMCGNGKIEPQTGETCDPDATCPVPNCNDNDPCTTDGVTGAACHTKECTHTPIAGCCPPGTEMWQNPNCPAVCGNGHVEKGEACDPETDCAPASCDDNDACTTDGVGVGLPCQKKQCTHTPIANCCPPNTEMWQNPACPARCGNDHIETGEQCDDANTLSGDGCSATCQTELLPP